MSALFRACFNAWRDVHLDSLTRWLDDRTGDMETFLKYKPSWKPAEDPPGVADRLRAHLACSRALLQHGIVPGSKVLENQEARKNFEKALEAAIKALRLPEGGVLPSGFVRDLAIELLTGGELKLRDGMPVGGLAPADREQSIAVLLVLPNDEGLLATLIVERVPGGSGHLYPIPALSLLPRDRFFTQAEDNARKYVQDELGDFWRKPAAEESPPGTASPETSGSRPPEYDVRWRLRLFQQGRPLPPKLGGSSLGAAFGMVIAKLMVGE